MVLVGAGVEVVEVPPEMTVRADKTDAAATGPTPQTFVI